VEVWCVDIEGCAPLEPRLSAVLDDHDRDRASRFVSPSDARRYRIAHGALRTILGRHIGIEPRRIRFVFGAHGKPLLRDGGPRFSLSHSGALALVAVSADRDVGVDVEEVRAISAAGTLAQRFFSPEEARKIADQPRGDRDRQFMRSWTAMEAVLKAEGTGLGAWERSEADGMRAPIAGKPRWSVRRLDLASTHVGAVAAQGGNFTVRMRRFG
jgi:4'-phosphopantetheinyl transferase